MTRRTATTPIRDAASVILVRDRATRPRVLMGQRSRNAAFMPGVFVFPGGAVDEEDARIPLHSNVNTTCRQRLCEGGDNRLATALQAAAIREVSEETGLLLGRSGNWSEPAPRGWEVFHQNTCLPCASDFRFVFRAITPHGAPRRFDARFFLVDADTAVHGGSLDDFSGAADELSGLSWIPLDEVSSLRIAFITTLALETATPLMAHDDSPADVPCIAGEREQLLRNARADRSRFVF